MRKTYGIMILSLALALLLAGGALADSVPVAPEPVAGRIMAVVVNGAGAEVFGDVFKADADFTPLETIPEGEEVDIQTLGLGWCRLRREDKEVRYVRTVDLSFSSEDFSNQIAIVFLKRSSKMPLHRTADAKSKRITSVPDGSYVVVLEKGEKFSHVLYGKYDGYLQNAYLSFREPFPTVRQGYLRDPKNAKRKTTINLRSADSSSGKKVKVLATRQYVTVLQFRGDWAEIETSKGLHGYLKADWVELTEPAPAAEPAEEPEVKEEPAEKKEPEEKKEEPEGQEAGPQDEEPGESIPDDEDYVDEADEDEASVAADDAGDEGLEPEWVE